MNPARILLLVVALVAGLLAAFLVMRGGGETTPDTVVTEVVREEARARVLVASTAIGIGQKLSSGNLEWADWPEGAVRAEYVTEQAQPDARAELSGALVRFEIFPGEPIRQQKLVRADQGYLSAVLDKGKRGVSVPVSAAAGAGGFIVPNDRVDVVLTRALENEGVMISDTVLQNVRVLAIGERLGEVGATGGDEQVAAGENPQAQMFVNQTIATLELTPGQAEVLINAQSQGALSLTLRSITDFDGDAILASGKSSDSVTMIRYGNATNVRPGTQGGGAAGSANPAGSTAAPNFNQSVSSVSGLDASQMVSASPPSQAANSSLPSIEIR
ncbi:Flp pilus assembly protein CpaB [Devosia pacifica]|uniref:Flp pilus assembly protein CpaB n=1 Tax=Devosia pacifica TaxID=1335967 RepID=A0A918SC04_9HYPH|nr:Flp pilus assembly protein CpaB [Devosia pacifica]GHA31942.1 Flp pilus assembly protein CpaB [Devosia pacifica]